MAGGSAAAAVEETEAALAAGLPPSAATGAAFLALQTLRLGGRYDMTMRMLDAGMEGARREGHVTRQALIHAQRAEVALAQGALKDAQVEAETGLRVVDEQHFAVLQLLAIAIVADVERGALDAAAELVRQGDALGVAEDRLYIAEYLTARGRLRIAQGRGRGGRRGPALVRRTARGAARALAERLAGVRGPVPGGGGRRGGRRAARPRAARRRPRRRRAP